jgi:hypothetical protein
MDTDTPTPAPVTKRIAAIHAWYNATTRQQVKQVFFEHDWFEFFSAGYTEEDFQTVTHQVLKDIKANTRPKGAIQLSVLIRQLDRFDEKLNLARAELDPVKIRQQQARAEAERIEETISRPPAGYAAWWKKQGWGEKPFPWHELDRDVRIKCCKELASK